MVKLVAFATHYRSRAVVVKRRWDVASIPPSLGRAQRTRNAATSGILEIDHDRVSDGSRSSRSFRFIQVPFLCALPAKVGMEATSHFASRQRSEPIMCSKWTNFTSRAAWHSRSAGGLVCDLRRRGQHHANQLELVWMGRRLVRTNSKFAPQLASEFRVFTRILYTLVRAAM